MAPFKSGAGRNLGKLVKSYLSGNIGGTVGPGSVTGFTILAGPEPEIGLVVDMQLRPTYSFTPNSTYTLAFNAPFTCRWEVCGEGVDGSPGRPHSNGTPNPPVSGTPSVLSNPNFILTAGAGTGGAGGAGNSNGTAGTGGVGSFTTPGPAPGTYSGVNGLAGAGGLAGSAADPGQPGTPGDPAATVYSGSTITALYDGGPNAGGTGGPGGGIGGGGGGGGGGAGTGSYVVLDTHVIQPGNYTLNLGPGNSGAAIIFQSL